jgi:site-specific DNA recombinase
MKTGALAYIRVSTLKQADQFNLENQDSVLRELEKIKGAPILVQPFSDIGRSGHIDADQRPGFQAMLKYAKEHKHEIKHVYFASDSRMSRDIVQALHVAFELFPRLGIVPVYGNAPGLDFTIEEDQIKLAQMFQDSWAFSKRKSRDAKKSTKNAVKNGRWPWKPKQFYFSRGGKTGANVAPDEERAGHFRRLAELIVHADFSITDALKQVTAEGLRDLKGKPYSYNKICDYLRDPFYAGMVRYQVELPDGRKEYTEPSPGLHEPLYSQAFYYRLQDKLDGNKTHGGKRKPRADHPFRARHECGTKLTVDLKKGGKHVYYLCPKCKVYFRAAVIEEQIRAQVLAPFSDVMKEWWLERAADFYSRQTVSTQERQRELQRRIAALEQLKRKAVERAVNTADEELQEAYEQQAKKAGTQMRELQAELSMLAEDNGQKDEWLKFAEMLYSANVGKLWELCTPVEREQVRSLLISGDSLFSQKGEISNSATDSLHGVLTETPEEMQGWLPPRDSNPDMLIQSQLSCR